MPTAVNGSRFLQSTDGGVRRHSGFLIDGAILTSSTDLAPGTARAAGADLTASTDLAPDTARVTGADLTASAHLTTSADLFGVAAAG